MKNNVFVRLDADSIGDAIELALLNNDIKEASRIHKIVQRSISDIAKIIRKEKNKILMIGCDDILFYVNKRDFNEEFISNLKNTFYSKTGFSLSIGVGLTLSDTLLNLRKAKLDGKNKIVMF